MAFFCNKQDLKNLNRMIEAICNPTLVVSSEGDPWTYILESDKDYLRFLVTTEITWAGGAQSTTEIYESTCCCVEVRDEIKCYPYDDGVNNNNLCADNGGGIYSYARRELK